MNMKGTILVAATVDMQLLVQLVQLVCRWQANPTKINLKGP